jgi:transposase
MQQHTQKEPVCAGVDVSKAKLDIALTSQETRTWQFANTPTGHAELIAFLDRHAVERVGLEATGGYEIELVQALQDGGFGVIVFQPRQVKAYAHFKLKRAKSDRIDAQLIAQCTLAQGKPGPLRDPRFIPLAEHLVRLEQIEEDLARAKTRRERFRDPRLKAQIEEDIARLSIAKRTEIKALLAAVRAHADLARKLDLLVGIQGVGERTALALLIRMPELGTLSREEAASLLGVAPFIQQTGKSDRPRRTGGGRTRLRTSLFAATQAAARRWNPPLIALYERLTKAGKPHAMAIVACMRKLIIYANAIIAKDTPWTPA